MMNIVWGSKMPASLTKYRIGFLAIGLFSLVLFVFVLSQAGTTKQDNDTYNKASDIASKLNDYVDNSYKVPSSLNDAGIKDVPAAITYQKLSGDNYRFCVSYKASSTGFSPQGAEADLLSAATGGVAGSSSMDSGAYGTYDLYLNSTHHKGLNCQTVNTQISSSITSDNSQPNGGGLNTPPSSNQDNQSNQTDPYAACASIADDQAYSQCINNADKQQNP